MCCTVPQLSEEVCPVVAPALEFVDLTGYSSGLRKQFL